MKIFYTFLISIVALVANAQAPQGFSYQATVRNNAGALMTNASVQLKFSILQDTATGTVVYSESQTKTTDGLGQVSTVVGQGTALTGTFAAINWGTGSHFLAIELNTGNGFVAMGTTQLLSVPYALYANSAGNSQGPQGPAGQDGKNTLVITTTEPAGANCPNGGAKIEVGLDADGNGILDTGEVNSSLTKYVCNGGNLSSSGGASNTVHGMATFNNIGQITDWVVPNGVFTIEIYVNSSIGGTGGRAIGRNGANIYNGGPPGVYGSARVVLNVLPGQIIKYYIGNDGANGEDRSYVLNVPNTFGQAGFQGETSYIEYQTLRGMNILGSGGGGGGFVTSSGGGATGAQGAPGRLDMTGLYENGFFPEDRSNPYSNQKQTILFRY